MGDNFSFSGFQEQFWSLKWSFNAQVQREVADAVVDADVVYKAMSQVWGSSDIRTGDGQTPYSIYGSLRMQNNIEDTLSAPISVDNFDHTVLVFRDRQAGVAAIYDPFEERYLYNAYCLEKKLMKELFSQEYDFLEDAITVINEEFGSWEMESFDKKGCSSCVAKK